MDGRDVHIEPDDRLVRRVQKGDNDSFRELMHRYQHAVFGLSYRILRRREDAEDVVQETFLRVYQSLSNYQEAGRFWQWVRRIAVNICLKRIPRELPSDDVDTAIDALQEIGDPVAAEVLQRLASADVRDAIAGLPAEYRVVIALRYGEDLSYKEISESIGEPVTTVQVRLHRAKKMLNERLAVMVYEV